MSSASHTHDDTADQGRASAKRRWASLLWESTEGPTGPPILANLYGLRDRGQLRDREYGETTKRALEISSGAITIARTGDGAEWRAIHAHLFGEIYPWAGQFRDIGMRLNDFRFLAPERIEAVLAETTARIRATDWAHLNRDRFITEVARALMDLNWVHPFRDGNGRSLRLFLDRALAAAPWKLNYTAVDADTWNQAHYDTRVHGTRRPTDLISPRSVVRRIATERPADHGHRIGQTIDAAALVISTPPSPAPDDTAVTVEDNANGPGHTPSVD